MVSNTPAACPFCGNINYYGENQTAYLCIHCATVVQLTNFQAEAKKVESAVLDRLDDLVLQRRAEKLQQMNSLFAQATGLQRSRRFTEAEQMYRQLLTQEGDDDPELYWRILMCRYCVEYQQDDDGKYVPFILYPDLEPCCNQPEYDYLFDCTKSDEQAADYRQKLDAIEAILSRYRQLRPTLQYDVFISVKQSRPGGGYTPDSDKAFELYHYLTKKGLKVFNSRCTPIPAGQEYEPYIISALISSKVMIVVGSTPENMEARWVKNEWSRFQWLQQFERTHRLLFCYLVGGMDPYSIPRELNPNKQAIQDGIGAEARLDATLRPMFKTIYDNQQAIPAPTPAPAAPNDSQTKHEAKQFVILGERRLNKKDYSGAEEMFEKALLSDAECAEAYIGLVCAEQKVPSTVHLRTLNRAFHNSINFEYALRFADAENRRLYQSWAAEAAEREKAEEERTVQEEEAERIAREEEEKRRTEMLVAVRKELGRIAAGRYQTVGLKKDGTVVAAGSNGYGQCDVSGWTDIVQVTAGFSHTVGLKKDGTVVAAGYNKQGQCNASGWTDIVQVTAGDFHTIGLKQDGTVVATGNNDDGKCNVSDWTDIVQVAAGEDRTVGLKKDGTVVAVGNNDSGRCNVRRWTDIVQVAAGAAHTVGLKKDGTVVAVGKKDYGQCKVSSWTDIVQVAAGTNHTVGLKKDGTVVAAGQNDYGQCNVSSWTDIVQVAAGYYHTVGLKTDGTVVAVGYTDNGECNVRKWNLNAAEEEKRKAEAERILPEDKDNRRTEMLVAARKEPLGRIAAGFYQTVGLKKDGTVVAVGKKLFGRCNVKKWTDIVQVAAGWDLTVGLKRDGSVVATGVKFLNDCDVSDWSWKNIIQVATGSAHIVGLRKDCTVVAAGTNTFGECNVIWWTDIVQVAARRNHTVGLKKDGTVVAVGDNDDGQCNVSDWTDIVQVAAGTELTIGLKKDGTVVAVGRNTFGQCNVSDWTDIVQVAAGYAYTAGLKKDGTVVTVGSMNSDEQRSISSWTDIVQVAAGHHHIVGLKADGTVVAVGDKDNGKCNVRKWNLN